MYDLAIIGGGPAGVAGGIYASRKNLKTIFLTKAFGGQSIVSEEIQNWIGTPRISGAELAKNLENHLREYSADFVDIKEGFTVSSVVKTDNGFEIKIESGETFLSKTVLLALGGARRKLEIPGVDKFENKGISYCASCDGPLFSGVDIVVIGGGNAAFESAAQLLAYAKSVTILNKSDTFRADEVTVKKVLSHQNARAVKNIELLSIDGEQFVSSIKYKDIKTGEIVSLATQGIFVEIGMIPATGLVKDLVNINQWGRIVVDPRTQATSMPGVWAAGDCTDGLYFQNNIAAGDAVKALEDIYNYLKAR